jgi:hemerythrin superfamily protein
MTASQKLSRKGAAPSADAIALLRADHKKVKALFKEFAKLKESEGSGAEKAALVKQICDALTVHAEIEEELFYPAVREAIDAEDLMDEALVEHAGAKALIAQLQQMAPDDDLYDAKVTVLGEQIDHHVKEEEGDIFLKAKKAKLDTAELGVAMAERKEALMAEMGLSEDDEGAVPRSSRKKKKK